MLELAVEWVAEPEHRSEGGFCRDLPCLIVEGYLVKRTDCVKVNLRQEMALYEFSWSLNGGSEHGGGVLFVHEHEPHRSPTYSHHRILTSPVCGL